MTCHEMALELIDNGFSVIPIRPNDKQALLPWKEFQHRIATEDEIEDWFTLWPNANLGLVTGSISGLFVVDADGPEGEEILADPEQCPVTSMYQKTPNGVHGFYRLPRGVLIKSSVRIRPEIDIRGEAGYVVIAPSERNGVAYELVEVSGMGGWDGLIEWEGFKPLRPAGTGNLDGIIDLSKIQPAVTKYDDVPKGGRNNALTRRVGELFAKDLDIDEVELLAREWNKKHCDPPLGDSELMTTINSIAKKHAINHPDPGVKVAPVPDVCEEEPELDPELLNPGGLISSIMKHIDSTGAPSFPLYNMAAGICLVGTAAGQRFIGHTGLRTNFYCICLGYSGSGKNAALDAIEELLSEGNVSNALGPSDLASAASVLNWLAAKPVTLLPIDEFGHFLGGSKNKDNMLKDLPRHMMELSTAVKRSYRKVYASKDDLVLPYHHLSVYGATTPETFWDAIKSTQAVDGFLGRLIVVEYLGPGEKYRAPKDLKPPRHITAALNRIWDSKPAGYKGGNLDGIAGGSTEGIPIPHVIPLTPEAEALFLPWEDYYHNLKNKHRRERSGIATIYGRTAERALQLALVHCISKHHENLINWDDKCTRKIEEDSMKWAMGLMDYLTRKMVTRMGENIADNAQEALRKKILTLINKHRTKAKPGVTERDLMRYSNKTKTEVKQAIETLQASGEITSIPHGKTSIWCPAIVDEDDNCHAVVEVS